MVASLRLWLWKGTGVAGAVALALSWQAGFTLTPESIPLTLAVAVAAAICCARPPASFGKHQALMEFLEAVVLLTVMSVFGALIAYAIVRDVPGFDDALLDRADAAIGFHWPAIYRFVIERPALNNLLWRAYISFAPMSLLIFVLLQRAKRSDHLYRYLLAHGLALVATLTICWIVPGQGPFAFYRDAGMPNAPGLPGYDIAIANLRDGTLTAINLFHLEGVVSFPSFHAAMAVLFVWAAWPTGWLWRGPILIVNGLMWLSAMPVGGHYAVDVVAGTLVALGAIAMATRLSRVGQASVAGREVDREVDRASATHGGAATA